MKYNKAYLPLIIGVAIAVGILIGFYMPHPQTGLYTNFPPSNDKLSRILDIIESDYVDTINRNELIEEAIPVMLRRLDPHSVYIPASDLARANEPLQGNFDGIGVSFNMLTDTVLIISTIPGGPSEKAGIIPGDKIIYVNDSLIAGKGIADDDVVKMLKGPRGTRVDLKIERKGAGELLPFTIIRDKIPIYSVDVSYMMSDDVGYIKISNFALTTHDEFKQGLDELKSKGMKKLVLDLRGNSGGVMEAATMIADEFLAEGKLIVFTMGKSTPRQDIKATSKGSFETGELVVLIDEWSASASEILAGAVQDNDRGTIIGRRSFGKGLVQEPVMFRDGSGMRLTIARYYTPTGRSIQKPYDQGVEKYYEDLGNRLMHGEFEEADSIRHTDSLRFTTPGGRTVYGGGGIMPDIFIPIDTMGITDYFLAIRNSGLIYRYALKFTEDNRETLGKFTDLPELREWLDNQDLLSKFVAFAGENGIPAQREQISISANVITVQLKAYIARNMLDNKGFYPLWQEIDKTLLEALNYIGNL
ncbi:MAG: PDZ domain-containing protein [Bacteroidales bacterium]|jgi:carboxyl-terminal processing protease|nr:PDZ domain-containing protein [Bacteroidales bacterium]MCB9028102.1 PDZ domain-containing protein [Bacteroidales bacterium]MDD3735616.1 S41 family peptidase [Bacteroidales bacterium]NLD63450.1 PDZ domain-containing protein [Bacteroidales bacterium]HNT92538.1 S41 family peptidase [Bacteroidales bacterium]